MGEHQPRPVSYRARMEASEPEAIVDQMRTFYFLWGSWGVEKPGDFIFDELAARVSPTLDGGVGASGEVIVTGAAIEQALEMVCEGLSYSAVESARRRSVASKMSVCVQVMRQKTGESGYLPPFFSESPRDFFRRQQEAKS